MPGVTGVHGTLKGNVVSLASTKQIELRVEIFNLFNNFNWGLPVTNFNAGTFGKITTAGGELVDTIDLGAGAAGRNYFTWDGKAKYSGDASQLRYSVVATNGTTAVASTVSTYRIARANWLSTLASMSSRMRSGVSWYTIGYQMAPLYCSQ